MHRYKIEYLPQDPENVTIVEMDRPFLTRRDFRTIVGFLFITACCGIDYSHMVITVTRDGERVFEMRAETVENGSVIDCYVSIDGQFYRVMNIAS